MDLDSSSAKPPEKAEACVANVAPKASAPSPEPVPGESLGPAKCRTPIASAKTPVLYRKTPWNVTPRSTATTPYAKSFLAMRSPKVAEVLREADTARFEARYHLKVAELRKANEAIKKLTAEVAEAAVLKQSLAEKEEELKESRKELRDSKQRTEELQRDHFALQEKHSALASDHAAALESAAEKERLLLKDQQAASNHRIREQSLSLHTMTDIMKMTRRGLALAQTMRRTHLVSSSPDVLSLKESLMTRSAAMGVGEQAEARASIKDGMGMGEMRGESSSTEAEGASVDISLDTAEEELEREPSLMSIAASSDILEAATVHTSPLFLADAAEADAPSTSVLEGVCCELISTSQQEEGFELELPLCGELSFEYDGGLAGGSLGTDKVLEGASETLRMESDAAAGGGVEPARMQEEEDEQEEPQGVSAKRAGSASLTIAQWSPRSSSLVLTSSDRRRESRTPGKSRREGAEADARPSPRSALASIQNLGSASFSGLANPRKPKYAPSPDIENSSQLTQGVKEGTPVGRHLSSSLSKQFSPKRSSLGAAEKPSTSSQLASPLVPRCPSVLTEKCQVDPSALSGRSPIVARFAERNSPLLRGFRLSQAFAKPVDSPSRFQDPKPAPFGGVRTPLDTSPPTARRLLIDTPPKEPANLEDPPVKTPGLEPKCTPPLASPYLGWPMPALVEISPPPQPVAPTPKAPLSTLGAQPSQLLGPKEPVTPNALLARADSLGGSPYFADLTTPVRSIAPSERSLATSESTLGGEAKGSGFDWGVKEHPPKLPGLALPSKPLLDYSGPPSRKRTNFGLQGFGDVSGTNRDLQLDGFEGLSKGLGEVPVKDPEPVQGFDAPRERVAGIRGQAASESPTKSGGATENEEEEGTRSPAKGSVRQRVVAFEQGTVTSAVGGPVRRARRQGRLSKELGRTRGSTGEGGGEPATELAAQGIGTEPKRPVRSVTLKDITSKRRGSADSTSGSLPRTPEIVEFAPGFPPSAAPQTSPPVSDPPAAHPGGTGICSVLVVLEEGKKGSARAAQKAPNVIGCIEVPKTTTLAELRDRIRTELGAKGPERFAFLQAGIGATWHAFSSEIEGLVTALTLPVADGPYQQLGEAAEVPIPTGPPVPSPTRHAVRLAILRPLPVKRTLYSANAPNGMDRTATDLAEGGSQRRLAGRPAETGEALSGQGPRSRLPNEAPRFPGPWATRPAPTLAGLSVRMTGGLREVAIADAARRETRLRSRDK